jgi:transglutaminase-like putative cysteine protease
VRVLSVRHVTTYRYTEPVELGEHRMMFRPRESHDLRLIRTRLEITPQPTELRWLHDVFDNSVAVATFSGATNLLRFDSMITLEHVETKLPEYVLESAARRFPFDYSHDERPDLAQALHRPDPCIEIDRWAAGFLPIVQTHASAVGASDLSHAAGTPDANRAVGAPDLNRAVGTPDTPRAIGTMDLLRAMALGIRKQLRYVRREERGVQTPVETLRHGSGTCRDFAWLMIDAVRSLGLAARFVSGYIYVPDAAQTARHTSLQPDHGGATHAWLQVYLPGAGWVDFDPTNSLIGNRNLIRVAVAWSPVQALPLWGTYRGSASSCLGMQVAVSVTEDEIPMFS